MILAAIFDMDGVLTDSEPLINAAAVEMFREMGLTVRPEDFISTSVLRRSALMRSTCSSFRNGFLLFPERRRSCIRAGRRA
jgi:beta-phosphoglucomutase-like phosphatase (HAD superfamily)